MSVYAKTGLHARSSLTSGSLLGSTAMRRLLALVGCSISLGSAGALLLNSVEKRPVVAEIPASLETLHTVLSQNSERKYAMAREMFAAGELDQPPSAVPAVYPVRQEQAGVIIHEVKQDETLWHLTQMYRVDAASIAASNNISSATELQIGTKLVIPPVDGLVHKVRPGDTLDSIAAFYRVPKAEILKYSAVADGDFLPIDQPLVIPGNVSQLLSVKEENTKRSYLPNAIACAAVLPRWKARLSLSATLNSRLGLPNLPKLALGLTRICSLRPMWCAQGYGGNHCPPPWGFSAGNSRTQQSRESPLVADRSGVAGSYQRESSSQSRAS